MNRINRKTIIHATGEGGGHPRPFLKRIGNKKLRRLPVTESGSPTYRSRSKDRSYKRDYACPLCLSNLKHQYKDAEFKHYGDCLACGASKTGEYRCRYCRSRNIWKSVQSTRCKRCGKYEHPRKSWKIDMNKKSIAGAEPGIPFGTALIAKVDP